MNFHYASGFNHRPYSNYRSSPLGYDAWGNPVYETVASSPPVRPINSLSYEEWVYLYGTPPPSYSSSTSGRSVVQSYGQGSGGGSMNNEPKENESGNSEVAAAVPENTFWRSGNTVYANGNALSAYASHPSHRTMMEMTGHRAYLRPDASYPDPSRERPHWMERRLTESTLIQTRGTENNPPCAQCGQGHGIWESCISLDGYFGNACANCKRQDHAAQCTCSETYWNQQEIIEEASYGAGSSAYTTRSNRRTYRPARYSR